MGARPERVIHADWSVIPGKRWAARAVLQPNGRYLAGAPIGILPDQLLAELRKGSTLLGLDLPVGLPAAYMAQLGATSFLDLLPRLGQGDWARFFEVAASREEISLHRPFYPARPGGTRLDHLVEALGLRSAADLYRRCDKGEGRQACPLFWTLGANQVGKAALHGWRHVLQPARAEGLIDMWPFDGSLDDLLERGRAVVVETYPAISYARIGATLPATGDGRGKRSRTSRAASAAGILQWAEQASTDIAPKLAFALHDGFGDYNNGEDRFDAVAGLLGMLAVLEGGSQSGLPDDANVQQLEGWMLGRCESHPS